MSRDPYFYLCDGLDRTNECDFKTSSNEMFYLDENWKLLFTLFTTFQSSAGMGTLNLTALPQKQIPHKLPKCQVFRSGLLLNSSTLGILKFCSINSQHSFYLS